MFERIVFGKKYGFKRDLDFIIPKNSIILVEGRSRTGKTMIASQIVSQLGHRHILQFDYSGEWALKKYSNCFSRHANWGWYLPMLHCIKNVGYPISYYDLQTDWLSLGMGESASKTVAAIARQKSAHKNEFETFYKICTNPLMASSTQFWKLQGIQ